MHELGIVVHVAKTLTELAEENNLKRIGSVTLEVGEVSGIITDYFVDCWNYFKVRYPLLKDCEMKLEIIKGADPKNATPYELKTVNACLTKYTDAYNNKNGEKAPMGTMIMGLMTSPDYSFKDFKAVVDNGYKGNNSIWDELLKSDFTEKLCSVRVPYHILQGDTDIVASTTVVKSVVDASENENLRYTIVKNTGHFPGVEMMDKVFESLCELA